MDALDVRQAAQDAPNSPALIFREFTLSFGELEEEVEPRAAEIQRTWAQCGAPHSFVAEPTRQGLVEIYACLSARVPFVPLHPRLPDQERRALAARVRGHSVSEQVSAVLFTSGTSGTPKGVLLSRRAFLASGTASETNLGWQGKDRWLLAMPTAHAGGLSIITRCLAARIPVVVEPNFHPAENLRAMKRESVTLASVVPVMLKDLLDADTDSVLPALRAVLVGGAPCPAQLLERARSRGVSVVTTYGLTEACSQIATGRLRDGRSATGASAYPLAGARVRVRTAQGTDAETGETGLLEVAGDMLFSGYLGGPAHPRGAWFQTRDLGALEPSGALEITGRADDLIISGGENVHPAEVERALLVHPAITDALCFGIPDPRWGQTVAALVVLTPPGANVEEVLAEVNETLPSFRQPKHLVPVSELPRNALGKPDRAAARSRLLSSHRR